MKSYEEELQNKIESGASGEDNGLDARAYREVFRALEKEPGYKLPSTFAEKVVAKVAARQKTEQSRDYFWFFSGVLVLLIAAAATIAVTGFKLDFGFLTSMADYKGLAIFGVVFVAVLNWLDRRLVREKLMHH